MVHLNPASVQAYGRQANEEFRGIRSQLEKLVEDVVDVKYYGGNAANFKSKCVELATGFATDLTADIRRIADAVQAATSNISGALGGAPVRFDVSGGPIAARAVPPDDGTAGASVPELESLKSLVDSRFAAIRGHFDAHLNALRTTDWEGNAKTSSVEAITRFTQSAIDKIDGAKTSVNQYIADQIGEIVTSDK